MRFVMLMWMGTDMITRSQAKKLLQLIARYRDAEIDDSWKGGGDPAHIPDIEDELRESKEALEKYIHKLQLPTRRRT